MVCCTSASFPFWACSSLRNCSFSFFRRLCCFSSCCSLSAMLLNWLSTVMLFSYFGTQLFFQRCHDLAHPSIYLLISEGLLLIQEGKVNGHRLFSCTQLLALEHIKQAYLLQ